MRILLENAVNLEIDLNGETAFIKACNQGKVSILEVVALRYSY